MVTMDRPIMAYLVNSPEAKEKWAIAAELKPMVAELVSLDYSGWRRPFSADGFTDAHVQTLDALVEEWIGQIDVDNLSQQPATVKDVADNPELEQVVGDWLELVPRDGISAAAARSEFPNRFSALCCALRQVARAIDAAIEFERMQRQEQTEPAADWSMTPEQVAEGRALAEAWPRY